MRDYQKIAQDEGYWALFRQRDLENIKAYLRRSTRLVDENTLSSPALDDMKRVMELCARNNITLHMVTYPYHAHLLEIIRMTGHWPAFENWVREISTITATSLGPSGNSHVSLWLFSGFTELSTEPVPDKSDRKAKMHWYWEAGHFKKELGDLMLDRILDTGKEMPDFGTRLTPQNAEEWIIRARAQEAEYRRNHSGEIAELEHITNQISARTHTRPEPVMPQGKF
jgi:hypothetical protein